MEVELFKRLLVVGLPSTFILGVLIALLVVKWWSHIKLFISDIFWNGPHTIFKSGRKFNTKCEIEGSINCFVTEVNSEVINPMLSGCQIQWVTEENEESVVEEGKAIIRVSYEKNNHDLNFYNAAYSFVRTSLLYRTKPFLDKLSAKGLDLLLTRDLIRRRNRVVLTVFNQKFRQEDEELKNVYYQFEEIENGGLFKLLLLQELYFFGENIGNKTPHKDYEDEAERFIDWVYNFTKREQGERTELLYETQNIKAAILLVASEDTYNKYGVEAYVRRAKKNASNEYPMIYILARGEKRSKIALEVAKKLEETGCFSILTKKYFTRKINLNQYQTITCIPLKTEITTIIQQAWTQIENNFKKSEPICVLIESISDSDILVDAYGLKIDIKNENLSNSPIKFPAKYFSSGMELIVNITAFDLSKELIELSNKGTKTDPEQYIKSISNKVNVELTASVEKIIKSNNYETGIIIKFKEIDSLGYIRRSKATYSRFLALSEKYKVDDEIKVIPEYFDINHASLVCKVSNLADPWENIDKYKKDQ